MTASHKKVEIAMQDVIISWTNIMAHIVVPQGFVSIFLVFYPHEPQNTSDKMLTYFLIKA